MTRPRPRHRRITSSSVSYKYIFLALTAAVLMNFLLVMLMHHLQKTDLENPRKYTLREIKFNTPKPKLLKPPESKKPEEKKKKKRKLKKPKPKILKKPIKINKIKMKPPPLDFRLQLNELPNAFSIAPPNANTEPAPEPEVVEIAEPTEEESRIYEIDAVDRAPQALQRKVPAYPLSAKRLGIEGWVDIEFIVDEVGKIIKVHVLESSSKRFEQSAVSAVYNWRFKPAVKNNRTVPVICRQKLEFVLN